MPDEVPVGAGSNPGPRMYLPRHFEETRAPILHEFIRAHPLGVLVGLTSSGLVANHIPFEVDLETPEGQARVRDYVRRLDLRHPPVPAPEQQFLHFGDTPEVLRSWLVSRDERFPGAGDGRAPCG